MRNVHTITVHAEPSDIDGLDHVSNLVYLRWVLEAATEHSAAVGLDTAAYRDLGAIFVVRRHEIDYMIPAILGDRIRVTTWVESWKRVSSVRRTELARERDGAVVARCASTWAFVTIDSGRPTPIPETVRTRFAPAL